MKCDEQQFNYSFAGNHEALRNLRAYYGCPCDGYSDTRTGFDRDVIMGPAEALMTHIEKVTGFRPAECPWYSRQDPLVRDILIQWSIGLTDDGVDLSVIYDKELPHIVYQGLRSFALAANNTRNHWKKEDAKLRADDLRHQEEKLKAKGPR